WKEEELGKWDSRVFYNMAFSLIQAQAPLLTDNNPIPTVIPRFDFMERPANAYTKAIEYLWDVLEMPMLTEKALIYAMAKKLGIFKVYFDKNKGFGGDICVDVVDPATFFIAPGYDDEWKAPFCGCKSIKPLSWIRRTFPKVKDVKAETSLFNDEKDKNAFKYQDASDFELDVRFATVYEVFVRNTEFVVDYPELDDKEGEKKGFLNFLKGKKKEEQKEEEGEEKEEDFGKYIYFTSDQFLDERPASDMHGLAPYVTVRDYIDPSGFLGIDEIDQTSTLIKEMNVMLQAIVKYARNHLNPNYEFDTSQYADADDIKEKLDQGGQVFSKNGMNNANPLLKPVIEAQMNPTVFNLFGIIPNLLEEISGITDVEKGQATKKQRQSASEIAILLESSHTRVRQKVRNLEWSLKRICYLFVKLMQQYYTEPRDIYNKLDEGYAYSKISNSREATGNMIASPQAIEKGQQFEAGRIKANEITPEDKDQYEDYKKFLEVFGDKDEIYFDFDIQIDTNSTLPLDKQTLANMFIRLAQMQLVDREAVLGTLKVPGWKAIVERMNKKEEEMKQAKMGSPPGGAPQAANPNNPQDQAEFQQIMAQMNGGQNE
ncbi:MAG: hypothetical protein WC450_12420, partial [Candidatus Omnitrophota bacterium]